MVEIYDSKRRAVSGRGKISESVTKRTAVKENINESIREDIYIYIYI